jgi:hypothetical protein
MKNKKQIEKCNFRKSILVNLIYHVVIFMLSLIICVNTESRLCLGHSVAKILNVHPIIAMLAVLPAFLKKSYSTTWDKELLISLVT